MRKYVAAAALMALISGPALAEPLHVVVRGGPMAPGERVLLRAEPPASASDHEHWVIVSGPGILGSSGEFKAPYIVLEGAVTVVRVTRGPKEAPIVATGELRLLAGSFPGADSCAGPDQAHIPELGEYVQADELPVAITTVIPDYPNSARARGITGGLVVNVLVCRSGHVIDAYAQWPVGSSPVASLEAAAVDAARQWVFRPATTAGQAVALWVAIPFRFPPP